MPKLYKKPARDTIHNYIQNRKVTMEKSESGKIGNIGKKQVKSKKGRILRCWIRGCMEVNILPAARLRW